MTPIEFALSDEEAGVAAARAAWRASLADGLLARHLAPLVAFVLTLLFAAVLGLTGLISRRTAEIALLSAAAVYMAYRLWTRRRFFAARRTANAWADTMRHAGAMRLTLDETALRLDSTALSSIFRFEDGLEIEEVAGLVYVWPRHGLPLVWPRRAHADTQAADDFLGFARRRAGAAHAMAARAPDDDD